MPTNRNVTRRLALLAALAALACTAPAAASADATILVKFASPTGASAKVDALGDDVTGKAVGGVEVVDPQPGESVADALARYRARPDVLYAEPNRVFHLFDLGAPSDTWYGDQWALPAISALGGWSIFPGTFSASPSVPVGIVDTGVDATHPDLSARVSSLSATCLDDACTQGVPTDDNGHGTHVSGIAGAQTDNGIGVAGLAYASPLIVVRVFAAGSGGAYDSDIANGIAWAASHGAKVINLSLGATGGPYPDDALQRRPAGDQLLRHGDRGRSRQRRPSRHARPRPRPGRPRVRARSASRRPTTATCPGPSRTTATRTSSSLPRRGRPLHLAGELLRLPRRDLDGSRRTWPAWSD